MLGEIMPQRQAADDRKSRLRELRDLLRYLDDVADGVFQLREANRHGWSVSFFFFWPERDIYIYISDFKGVRKKGGAKIARVDVAGNVNKRDF